MSVALWDLRMSRQFDAEAWKPWTPAEGKGLGGVQFINRAVTPVFLCDGADLLDLPAEHGSQVKKLVDNGSHCYIEDNVIEMYEHIKTDKVDR